MTLCNIVALILGELGIGSGMGIRLFYADYSKVAKKAHDIATKSIKIVLSYFIITLPKPNSVSPPVVLV
jgi:hypothetical protein